MIVLIGNQHIPCMITRNVARVTKSVIAQNYVGAGFISQQESRTRITIPGLGLLFFLYHQG